MDPTDIINKLIPLVAKRREFLEKNPHLQEFQDKIEATLDAVGTDPVERCQALQVIMSRTSGDLVEKMHEIYADLDRLQECVERLQNDYKSRR